MAEYQNFRFEVDADGIALATWDMAERSMNVITPHVMQDLSAIIDRVAGDEAIKGFASIGSDLALMLTGPIDVSELALRKAGMTKDDIDLFEINEAFSAVVLRYMQALDLDPAKVNVNGGAIALGHPIGASGARVLTTLLYEMQRRDAKKGLVTLCIGGGMGVAMCVERD